MESKELTIICLVIIAVVALGSFFIVFHKNTEINMVSSSELNKEDEIIISLTANGIDLKGQEINITATNENGETKVFNEVTDDSGKVYISLNDFSAGQYKISCNFQGNMQYSSSVGNYEISINDVAHETSSTSSDAGWPFDAPEGWHWIRTPPGETWLIKDDGSVDRLYYGKELLLENTKINGKSVKTYENPNIP